MTCTQEILTQTQNQVAEWLETPDLNRFDKMSYKIMAANLNGISKIVNLIHNVRQQKRIR